MNSFGRIFRVSIFGESHAHHVGVTIDGCPPGTELHKSMFEESFERRKPTQTGTTKRHESDIPQIISGVYRNIATGAPITILFDNKHHRSSDYKTAEFLPRPGHADLPAYIKYGGFNDHRGGGRFSGRLTVGLVAAGVVAGKIIDPISINAKLIEAGGKNDIEAAVAEAIENKDSIGGIIECRITGINAGLGEPFFDSLESAISHAVFSVPGIKGIEFGAGFGAAGMSGSEMNDAILSPDGSTETNNSGGINGGISNGNEIYFRVAVRPTPSIPQKQRTINLRTGEAEDIEIFGRHDTCFALRVPVIIEAVTACVIADMKLLQEKYQ